MEVDELKHLEMSQIQDQVTEQLNILSSSLFQLRKVFFKEILIDHNKKLFLCN